MMNRKVKQTLEAKKNDLLMNLANNYKDLAHSALKDLDQTLEGFKAEGAIKEKDYKKYKVFVDEYKDRMKDYKH